VAVGKLAIRFQSR